MKQLTQVSRIPIYLTLRLMAFTIMAFTVLHPLFHWLEGGALDMVIMYAEMWAYNALGTLPVLLDQP